MNLKKSLSSVKSMVSYKEGKIATPNGSKRRRFPFLRGKRLQPEHFRSLFKNNINRNPSLTNSIQIGL